MNALVQVKSLSKTFGSGHTAVNAVDNVSLEVNAGDIVLVMGPSGSGKTTLISMIGTLMRPTEGEISIDGRDIAELGPNDLSDLRLKSLGFMFQSFNLLSALTAEQNIAVPMLIAGVPKKRATVKAKELLTLLHLEQRLTNLPRDLSGGEKQRVAVARALANNPKLILADEPTANLDSKTGFEVMRLLCAIACKADKAVVIVSHDLRLRDVAKRVITIEDGRLTREEKGGHDTTCPHHSNANHENHS